MSAMMSLVNSYEYSWKLKENSVCEGFMVHPALDKEKEMMEGNLFNDEIIMLWLII